jgi:hypothetical protein
LPFHEGVTVPRQIKFLFYIDYIQTLDICLTMIAHKDA